MLRLNEGSEPPPERLLQAIWFHQRLLRDQLRTLDGIPIQVLHPGFWNREPGPDFRKAMLRFGRQPICSGDVEIDLHSHDWQAHRHHRNPEFTNVILHVVWDMPEPSERATLTLREVLDAPLEDLNFCLGPDAAKTFPLELLGLCCAPLRGLAGDRLSELLHQAAFVRLQAKGAQFQARARQAGWEQALWEGLFRALGYKQNLWPMQRLAELRLELCPVRSSPAVLELQARLLGIAGLLPEELTRRRSFPDRYLRRLWDCWWRERETFQEHLLPRTLWKLAAQRPANHPQRRLALAAHWLLDPLLLSRIEQWGTASLHPKAAPAALLAALQVPTDDYWSWHWTLRSGKFRQCRPLLGATRTTDLAMNVILPWLWIRAVEGKNQELQEILKARYLAWPSAEDNAVLRLARQRLLASNPAVLHGAAAQQGLLQIVKDFCEQSNSLCADCRFPELIRTWGTGEAG